MKKLDIWILPNTPKCDEIIDIVGDDPRVRLIDARQFRNYKPKELSEAPGFVWTDSKGKRHPWQGDNCLDYVRLYFSNPNRHLLGPHAGAPIMDVRQQQQMYSQQPQTHAPQQISYNQQPITPQQPNYNQPMRTPHSQRPPPQQQQQSQSQSQSMSSEPPKTMGFGQHKFTHAMQGQVNGKSVVAIDDSRMMLQGTQHKMSAQDVLSQRNQQDQMYLTRR